MVESKDVCKRNLACSNVFSDPSSHPSNPSIFAVRWSAHRMSQEGVSISSVAAFAFLIASATTPLSSGEDENNGAETGYRLFADGINPRKPHVLIRLGSKCPNQDSQA